MKEKLTEIKQKIFKKNFIGKSFFVAFLSIFFLFLFFNQYSIQFWINGYSKLNDCSLQVYFLDVGQANATLIVFPNKMAMIVDTGSQNSQDGFVEDVDYLLNRNGIEEIEYLVLTHSDEDHVGGTVALLEKFEVNNILRPKQLAEFESSNLGYTYVSTEIYKTAMEAVYAETACEKDFINDEVLRFGSATVEIFSCKKDFYSDTNSYSPFISIEYNGKRFLLTGDATAIRETEFINHLSEHKIEMDVDYLLVSHHGSKYSTTEEFLQAVNPRYAFVSAGESYYPSVEVKERLTEVSTENIFVTSQLGMIAVGIEDESELIWHMTTYFDAPFIFVCVCIVVFVFMKFLPHKKGKLKFKKKNYSIETK